MDYLKFAKTVAREAGEIIRNGYDKKRNINFKAGRELVTDIDMASENHIRERISKEYPEHHILAEEKGGNIDADKYLWVIDPLDGTTNFAHGFPIFCVSIALAYNGEIILGAIYEPLRNEIFWTKKDSKSYLNDDIIEVAGAKRLSEALLATGFPYDIAHDNENNLENFRKLSLGARGLRRAGSAAMDLCYVACGRLDGFWEMKLKPWDMAAGSIIVENAGGKCTDYQDNRWTLDSDRIIAANPGLHPRMSELIE
ncbi:MAG: inositol monophosphatase family protein [Candidatus Zixiibacteriota bacterium]